MTRTFHILIIAMIAAAAGMLSPAAHADYIVASRHALVKDEPERDAETLRAIERGAAFQLVDSEQTDGYYKVALDGDAVGWVYRTFVRRWPGNVPAELDSDDSSTHTSSGAGSASPWSYACLPVERNGSFPVKTLSQPHFVIGYSDDRKNPLWVCYAIGQATESTAFPRKSFTVDKRTDSRISTSDYDNCGFSRGHMAPKFALQSRFGKDGSNETFIMSNVCPQYQSFNDGQWGELETLIAGTNVGGTLTRGWADTFGQVWVTVGPIFDEERAPLDCGVEVPNAFYCIVIDLVGSAPRAMAFILDHEDERHADLSEKLVSIRNVEARTGLDFFSALPDSIEVPLESSKAVAMWPKTDQ